MFNKIFKYLEKRYPMMAVELRETIGLVPKGNDLLVRLEEAASKYKGNKFDAAFWIEYAIRDRFDPRLTYPVAIPFVRNGCHYVANLQAPGRAKGFDGTPFAIRRKCDGWPVYCANVWFQGTIPPEFLPFFEGIVDESPSIEAIPAAAKRYIITALEAAGIIDVY